MARIAVVTDQTNYVTAVRALGEGLDTQVVNAGSTSGIEQVTVAGVMAQRPDAILLGPGITQEQRVLLTQELDVLYPHVVVIWVVDEDPQVWRLAMKAGARDLLSPNASDEAVVEQLRRATTIADRRRDQSGVVRDTDTIDAPSLGRIVSIVSPKGGSGKTMLCTNLAVGLAETTDKTVVLVDLDLQFGDVTAALGLRPEYSVVDVIKASGDATATKAFLTAHSPGLFVLPAPTNPAEADEVEPEQIAKLLTMLRAEFGYVVVDTAAGIDEATLTAVEESTDVMFITTIDVAAIQALRKAVVVLDRLKLDQHNRWFVLNRANSKTGLSGSEIEEVTGLAIDAQIPSHRSISRSMNQGAPAIQFQRRSKVGRSLLEATRLLTKSRRRQVAGRQS